VAYVFADVGSMRVVAAEKAFSDRHSGQQFCFDQSCQIDRHSHQAIKGLMSFNLMADPLLR
jgi:hypothetical protein